MGYVNRTIKGSGTHKLRRPWELVLTRDGGGLMFSHQDLRDQNGHTGILVGGYAVKKDFLLKLSIAALSLLAFIGLAAPRANAQVLTTLHSFTSGVDGSYPFLGSLTVDASGNLYGVASNGGPSGYGIAFELSPVGGGSYTEQILHTFSGLAGDGATPYSTLIFDSAGNLYGTTQGGGANGAGTVYELVKSSGYGEIILYSFGSTAGDGSGPFAGLLMDSAGNLYGTTELGGANGTGTVFELALSSGSFVYQTLYTFGPAGKGGDGANPYAPLVMDAGGNLYGTTEAGGPYGVGTVFELANSSGSFTEKILHSFSSRVGDGSQPFAGLATDPAGNLYGTTSSGGANGAGTVFELVLSSGSYVYQILHSFNPAAGDGAYPYPSLIIDAAGNLYGATTNSIGVTGTSGPGVVFELVNSAGAYSENVLANFSAACSTGLYPFSGLARDSASTGRPNKAVPATSERSLRLAISLVHQSPQRPRSLPPAPRLPKATHSPSQPRLAPLQA
jgi:uncharacterized repeat protein (TIGR03803 family)